MDQPQKNKLRIFSQWLALVLLLVVLCYELWGITGGVVALTHAGFHPTHRRNSLNQPAVEQIQSWMTFRYVNLVFHLPPEYLKSNLAITDSRYPNISIGALAKEQKKSSSAEILLIQQAIATHAAVEEPKAP